MATKKVSLGYMEIIHGNLLISYTPSSSTYGDNILISDNVTIEFIYPENALLTQYIQKHFNKNGYNHKVNKENKTIIFSHVLNTVRNMSKDTTKYIVDAHKSKRFKETIKIINIYLKGIDEYTKLINSRINKVNNLKLKFDKKQFK